MDGYVAKELRKKRLYRCTIGNGSIEDESRTLEIAATNKVEAENNYRKTLIMQGKPIHALEPIMITLTEGNQNE